MKVLMVNRDPSLWVGGDSIQVYNTMTELEKLGVDVDFTHNQHIDPRGYDLVHCFHLNFFWTTVAQQQTKRYGVPYIVSAIYFDQEYDNTFPAMARLANSAEKIISLSKTEKKEIEDRLKISSDKIKIIPNGVDKSIFKRSEDKKDYVLYVGRLTGPQKGALQCAEACRRIGRKLITVGKSDDSAYSKEVKSLSWHIESVTQEELAKLYQSAGVYVCSSMTERQSLAVLEAAACGTSVVDSIYNRGNDLLPSSIVVDPNNLDALMGAIEIQMGRINHDEVPSWADVAKQVKEVYDQLQTNG